MTAVQIAAAAFGVPILAILVGIGGVSLRTVYGWPEAVTVPLSVITAVLVVWRYLVLVMRLR